MNFVTLLFHFHQEALQFFFTFCHKGGVICISEVIDISPGNLDSFHIISCSRWGQVACFQAVTWGCRFVRSSPALIQERKDCLPRCPLGVVSTQMGMGRQPMRDSLALCRGGLAVTHHFPSRPVMRARSWPQLVQEVGTQFF